MNQQDHHGKSRCVSSHSSESGILITNKPDAHFNISSNMNMSFTQK